MGQKLFSIKLTTPAIFFFIVGVVCAFGASRYLLDTHPTGAFNNYWTYNFLVGIVLSICALLAGAGGWLVVRQRTDFYEQGVVAFHKGKRIEARYADLKWFSLSELDVRGRAIRQSAVNFCTAQNVVFGTLAQSVIGRTDERILRIKALVTKALSERIESQMKQSGRAPWTYDKNNRVETELTPTGIIITASGAHVSFAEFELRVNDGSFSLSRAGGERIFAGTCSTPNFYPGFAVIQKICAKGAPAR